MNTEITKELVAQGLCSIRALEQPPLVRGGTEGAEATNNDAETNMDDLIGRATIAGNRNTNILPTRRILASFRASTSSCFRVWSSHLGVDCRPANQKHSIPFFMDACILSFKNYKVRSDRGIGMFTAFTLFIFHLTWNV